MKHFIFILVAVSVVSLQGCQKSTNTKISNDANLDFYQDGVHILVTKGCPIETKSSNYDKCLTFIGEKNDVNYTMYAVGINDNGYSIYEAYTENSTHIGTFV